MPLPMHWVNLRQGAQSSIVDRGFRYGDALFETLRYQRGHWHLLEFHLERMRHGCERLDFTFSEDSAHMHLRLAADWLQQQALEAACARLVISRGDSTRGYAASCEHANYSLALTSIEPPWRVPLPSAHLICCELRLPVQPALAGIKHSNRLEQVLAAREYVRRGADEGLLRNERGDIISAVAANVFAVFDDRVLTPPLLDCGVAGTVRRLLLEQLADSAGITIEVAPIPYEHLPMANELFLSNALIGIRSVASCEAVSFTSTRWADTLRELFFTHLDSQE